MQEVMNIKTYIRDISRYNRINPVEEKELGKKISKGDKEALDKLVTANLGLVLHVANRYRDKGISYEDLISEGNLGLMVAASKWSYKKNIRFSTYAYFWIKRHMLFALNSKLSLIRTPTNLSAAANSLGRALSRLEVEGHGKFSEAKIKAKFGKKYKNQSVDSILMKLRASYCTLEGENPDGSIYARASRHLRTESFERELENRDGRAKLKTRMNEILKESRHGRVVKTMFGLNGKAPYSGRSLAKRYGVSYQSVHNWRLETYRKIKKAYDVSDFYDYLQV
jgi:RNA polymerase primary sigma factor